MGDNIYLGDRNGVRTPMQWSADRNAGFSRANPQQLYLPVDHRSRVPLRGGQRRGAAEQPALAAVVDEAADRAAQAARGVRPRHARVPAPRQPQGAGVRPRSYEDETHPGRRQPVALRPVRRARPVARSRACVPVELFGRVEFPRDRRAAVLPDARARTASTGSRSRRRRRSAVDGDRAERADARASTARWHELLADAARGAARRARCPATCAARRWFRGKARSASRRRRSPTSSPVERADGRAAGSRCVARRVRRGRARDLRRCRWPWSRGERGAAPRARPSAVIARSRTLRTARRRAACSYDALVRRRRSPTRCWTSIRAPAPAAAGARGELRGVPTARAPRRCAAATSRCTAARARRRAEQHLGALRRPAAC